MAGAATGTSIGIVIALVGLAMAVVANIFVMARWSGRVDEKLEVILSQPSRWNSDLNAAAASIRAELKGEMGGVRAELDRMTEDVVTLRKARHEADGTIQRHEGSLSVQGRVLERILAACRLEHQDGLTR